MLGLPPSTDVRRAIPKDAFFSSKNIKGRDRERFDKQVHSITIRSIISPESVNIDRGKDVSAIYVMELQLNVQDCDDANLMLLDRLGHKTVYVLSYGDSSKIAVVEDILFQTDWSPATDRRLELEGLDLDAAWANIVRSLGDLPADVPLRDAVAEEKRVRCYNKQITDLEKQFQKERQNHERRRLHSEIRRLKEERDAKPVHIGTEQPAVESGSDFIIDPSRAPVFDGSGLFAERGVSVMNRVRHVGQPRGGFINPKNLKKTEFDDGKTLGEENIHPTTVGTVVDYLTRWTMGSPLQEAFSVSVKGGRIGGRSSEVEEHMSRIKGLDDDSVEGACRACMYDVYYRAGHPAAADPFQTFVDHQTCENIRTMVERSKRFLEAYGPVTDFMPVFPGAYTGTVGSGDGDCLTESTVWDFKISKNGPTKENTLQLAVYYIMGKHSVNRNFDTVGSIGIFNPRLNTAYTLDMSEVPEDVMRAIETEVIGYGESECLDWREHRDTHCPVQCSIGAVIIID